MAFCKQCGAKLDANAKFCPSCGIRIDQEVQPSEADVRSREDAHQKNKSFNLSDCMEYLEKVQSLELSCYELSNLHEKLDRKIMYANSNTEEIAKPSMILSLISGLFRAAISTIIAGIATFVILFVVMLVLSIVTAVLDKRYIFDIVADKTGMIITVGACIGAVIGIIITVCTYIIKKSAYDEAEEDRRNRTEQKVIIQPEIEKCEQSQHEQQKLLQEYYDLDYIYPKYRGLVPISTIYEYLASGRCSTLTGPNGAYNLYEMELRMNTIIGKLDDIIAHLEDISYSQRMLYDEVKASNQRVENLLAAIENTASNIERNTAMDAYYSQITASNAAYQSWLMTYFQR